MALQCSGAYSKGNLNTIVGTCELPRVRISAVIEIISRLPITSIILSCLSQREIELRGPIRKNTWGIGDEREKFYQCVCLCIHCARRLTNRAHLAAARGTRV